MAKFIVEIDDAELYDWLQFLAKKGYTPGVMQPQTAIRMALEVTEIDVISVSKVE